MSTSDDETRTAPTSDRRPASDPASHGRFSDGTMLDGRYRIVGLAGRGGMGEVYRAEDLRLGQLVALKFLPESLARDPLRVQLLHNEVRAARQVSHPHVCRMYDIGGSDGQLYLSMELVDGEDLAASLRRIGRFPEDKAIVICRQLCAGLAAMHERGVLHRDLKPANVMLDASGQVRIMDFGLAAIGDPEPSQAGSPGYMAPEQLAGKPATIETDIFALGLVLYEVFTGHKAFTAKSFADLALQHALSVPPPRDRVPSLDAAVESAILRCLEREPEDRPHSAFTVGAMMPGSDAFAGLLASGQTPSPEMVAAAGMIGAALSPRAGVAWIVALIAALAGTAWLADRATVPGVTEMRKPSVALREIATQMGQSFTGEHLPAYEASGFDYDRAALRWYAAHGGGAEHWRSLAAGRLPAIRYWHRTSRRPIDPLGDFKYITRDDPPATVPGDTIIDLDTEGHLLGLLVQPAPGANLPPAVWPRLFDAAGLDFAQFAPVASDEAPPLFADDALAWTGPARDRPGGEVRVSAATRHGSVVWMVVESERVGDAPADVSASAFAMSVASALVQAGLLFLMIRLAVLNVRANRADRRGAYRVAVFGFVVELLVWVLTPAHSPEPPRELLRFFAGFAYSCFFAVVFGSAYLGLEPYVRRYWPRALIAWTRLVSGRVTDPLVGRDLLVGVTAGLALASVSFAYPLLLPIIGGPSPSGWLPSLAPAAGLGAAFARPLYLLDFSVLNGLLGTFIMAVLRHRLRSTWIAAAAWMFVAGLLFDETSHIDSGTVRFLFASILTSGVGMLVLIRFGLLAFTAVALSSNLSTAMVFTLDPGRAYFAASLLPAAMILMLGVIGWRCATHSAAPLQRYNS